jgi:hypothetical protein
MWTVGDVLAGVCAERSHHLDPDELLLLLLVVVVVVVVMVCVFIW